MWSNSIWSRGHHRFYKKYIMKLLYRMYCSTIKGPFLLRIREMISTGTGKIIVEFFSAEILFRVCRYLNYKENSKFSQIYQRDCPGNFK